MRWRVKNYPLRGGLWEWGNRPNCFLEVKFRYLLGYQVYYLDIPAITKLLCLLFVLYVLVPSIYSFFYLTTALLKSDVFRHSKVYSSQFSTYRHRTGFIMKRKQVRIQESPWQNYKFVRFFLQIFKVVYFAPPPPKKYTYFKNFHKIYYSFFFQNDFPVYISMC